MRGGPLSRYDWESDQQARSRFRLRWGAFAGFAVNAPLFFVYLGMRAVWDLARPSTPPVPPPPPGPTVLEIAKHVGAGYWAPWAIILGIGVIIPSAVLLSRFRTRRAGRGFLLVGTATFLFGLAVVFGVDTIEFEPLPNR